MWWRPRTRTRYCSLGANGGDSCSGELKEVVECETQACNVDCTVSQWGAFTPCSGNCGNGTHTRTRSVTAVAQGAGTPCANFSLSEEQPCTNRPCPIDCVLGDWGGFGECSTTCGNNGRQTRTRDVVTPAAHGGTACDSKREESRDCNQGISAPLTAWSLSGVRSIPVPRRVAPALAPAPAPHDRAQGYRCVLSVISEAQPCATKPCPVDCVVSDWGGFSRCSVTCGDGTKARTRSVITPTANGGMCLPAG